MNPKRLIQTTAVTFLAAIAFSNVRASAADRLDEWMRIVPEQTTVALAMKNIPEIKADVEGSSFMKFWDNAEVQAWTKPMREGAGFLSKFQEKSGMTVEEALAPYTGACLFVLTMTSFDDFKTQPGIGALSEIDPAKADEFAKHKAKERAAKIKDAPALKEQTEEIAGVTLNILADPDDKDGAWVDAWAIVGDVAIEGNARWIMEHFIGALKENAGKDTTTSQHVKRIAAMTEGTTDVLLYVNGERIWTAVDEAVEKQAAGSPPGAMPFNPKDILNALGLKEFEALGFSFDLTKGNLRADFAILHPEHPAGLVNLFRGTSTEINLPAFIPADVDGAAVTRQGLANVWDLLMGMIQKMGPMAMMVPMQLTQMEQGLGFSIRNDLLGSLGDEIISAEQYAGFDENGAPKANQVVGFSIKDKAKFESSIAALAKFAGQGFAALEESDLLGHKMYSIKKPGNGPEISFVVADSYFFFSMGDIALLRKLLNQAKSPDGPSLWDDAEVKDIIATLPKDSTSLAVSNLGSVLKTAIGTIVNLQNMGGAAAALGGGGPQGKAGASFDMKAMPSDETFAKFFGRAASASYALPDGVHVRMIAREGSGE